MTSPRCITQAVCFCLPSHSNPVIFLLRIVKNRQPLEAQALGAAGDRCGQVCRSWRPGPRSHSESGIQLESWTQSPNCICSGRATSVQDSRTPAGAFVGSSTAPAPPPHAPARSQHPQPPPLLPTTLLRTQLLTTALPPHYHRTTSHRRAAQPNVAQRDTCGFAPSSPLFYTRIRTPSQLCPQRGRLAPTDHRPDLTRPNSTLVQNLPEDHRGPFVPANPARSSHYTTCCLLPSGHCRLDPVTPAVPSQSRTRGPDETPPATTTVNLATSRWRLLLPQPNILAVCRMFSARARSIRGEIA